MTNCRLIKGGIIMAGGAPLGNHNHTKHGMRNSRIYNIWRSMRQRCSNPNCRNFKHYGARGIKVCEEWNDFCIFYEWSLANGYSDRLTIDRIDTNKGYEPSNCRWATQEEQQNNRRNNRYLTVDGISHTMAEWSKITGIKTATIWRRLSVGCSVEKALGR